MRRLVCSKIIARLSSKVYSNMTQDLSLCWPVGSLFFTATDVLPSSLLGFGEWESLGAVSFKPKASKTVTAWMWRRIA